MSQNGNINFLPYGYLQDFCLKKMVDVNSTVSHYTNFSSLKGIIETGLIRASHCMYMNDPSDGMEFYDCFIAILMDLLKNTKFEYDIARLYAEASGSAFVEPSYLANPNISSSERIYRIFKLCEKLIRDKNSSFKGDSFNLNDLYLISFVVESENDYVGNWMSYGDDGFGVRIDINVGRAVLAAKDFIEKNMPHDVKPEAFIQFNSLGLYACEYLDAQEIRDKASQFLSHIDPIFDFSFPDDEAFNLSLEAIAISMFGVSSLIKNKSYSFERECRLIIKGIPAKKTNIGYHVSRQYLKPYREIGFDRNGISKIICGPRCDLRSVNSIYHLISTTKSKQFEKHKSSKEFSDIGMMPIIDMPYVVKSSVKYVGK